MQSAGYPIPFTAAWSTPLHVPIEQPSGLSPGRQKCKDAIQKARVVRQGPVQSTTPDDNPAIDQVSPCPGARGVCHLVFAATRIRPPLTAGPRRLALRGPPPWAIYIGFLGLVLSDFRSKTFRSVRTPGAAWPASQVRIADSQPASPARPATRNGVVTAESVNIIDGTGT